MNEVPTHWSELSRNPISKASTDHVRAQLAGAYAGRVLELPEFWKEVLENKDLLDIGVVEHSSDLMARTGWRHDIFKKLARSTVGLDILPNEVAALNARGYDVRLCDATSEADLGERFDVVYIGDVIEHVNDPIKLVMFAARHLNPQGEIIVTTPCPFWWRNILSSISNNTYIGNVDHVRWVCPVNALEIAHRAGVFLKGYHTIETSGRSMVRRAFQATVNGALGRSELFTWAYIFRLTAKA